MLQPESRPEPQWVWIDGTLTEWQDAQIHVDTQCVLGGLNVYEVIGCFTSSNGKNLNLFRVSDHFTRLHASSKVMRMQLPFSDDELLRAAQTLIEANGFRQDAGVRIVAYLGAGPVLDTAPVGVFIIAKPVAAGMRGQPLHLGTAVWSRITDTSAPPRVKSGANYQNARLARMQAKVDGYDDAVLLSAAGKVCELPLANIFMLREGKLVTPPATAGILEGITRKTVMDIAPDLGLQIVELEIDRSELYLADEVFATGTLSGISAVVSVDRYEVGNGRGGPVTDSLLRHLDNVVRGAGGHPGWLTSAYESGLTEGYATEAQR